MSNSGVGIDNAVRMRTGVGGIGLLVESLLRLKFGWEVAEVVRVSKGNGVPAIRESRE